MNKYELKEKLYKKESNYKEFYDDALDITDEYDLIHLKEEDQINQIFKLAKELYELSNEKLDTLSEWRKKHIQKFTTERPSSLYVWVHSDSTEFTPHSDYIWTDETWSICSRLEHGVGQCLAVVMEQGLGKTAFCYEVSKHLGEKATYVKLDGRKPIREQLEHGVFMNVNKFNRHLGEWGESPTIFPITTVIIEFPDYSKNSRTQATKDFARIEEMIGNNRGSNLSNKLEYNILLVWQRELPLDFHFLMGKWDARIIKHFTPETLADHVMRLYPDQNIFNYDALVASAFLAKGNIRSFKRYLSKCIERSRIEGVGLVNSSHVKKWINREEIALEWQRALSSVFPQSTYKIEIAVDLLTRIRENPMFQSNICSSFFDGDKVATSKFLVALENRRFIRRKMNGREKIVSPYTSDGVKGWYADSF